MSQNNAGFTGQHDADDHAAAVAPAEAQRGRGVRLVDWLNEHLMSTLGPPPLGPYGEIEVQVPAECPICGHRMGEHLIDRSKKNAVLTCPVPRPGQFEHVEDRPLNEVGMPRPPQ